MTYTRREFLKFASSAAMVTAAYAATSRLGPVGPQHLEPTNVQTVTVQGLEAGDRVAVFDADTMEPYLNKRAEGTSESVTVAYEVDQDLIVRVRNGGQIRPFETCATINGDGATVSVVRVKDSIVY